jgi:hypothetical protein
MSVQIFRFLLFSILLLFVIRIFSRSTSTGAGIKRGRENGKKVKMDGLPVKDADYIDVKDH